MWKRKIILCAAAILTAAAVSGCGLKFTSGFGPGVFAKVNGNKISMASAMLLLAESGYSYEKLFDAGVWDKQLGDVTTQEYVKASVKDTLMQLKYLELMAERMNVGISEAEAEKLDTAAREYWDTLSAAAVSWEKFEIGTVREFYGDLLLAEKVFYEATSDVDPEVSADEARIIDVQYIFVSTMTVGEDGEAVRLPESECRNKRALAESLLSLIAESDFATLAREYSDDSEYSLQFGRGERDADFEEAAFRLEMGSVSGVVETDYGYYMIKCINDNVDGNYDKRCSEIILSRRTEAFFEQYSEFIKDVETEFNGRAYEKLEMNAVISGSGQLYEIYNRHFVSTQSD